LSRGKPSHYPQVLKVPPIDDEMGHLKDLIIGEVEVNDDEDEDEESYDEETGEVRRKTNGAKTTNGVNGHLDDSSEEDEDDDDEEAARLVRPLAGLAARANADCMALGERGLHRGR